MPSSTASSATGTRRRSSSVRLVDCGGLADISRGPCRFLHRYRLRPQGCQCVLANRMGRPRPPPPRLPLLPSITHCHGSPGHVHRYQPSQALRFPAQVGPYHAPPWSHDLCVVRGWTSHLGLDPRAFFRRGSRSRQYPHAHRWVLCCLACANG